MTGLFVNDEARDFLPGKLTSASKQSLLQLARQARKYGLGLILATQNPMDLDYNAAAQCSTQFFAKANAPQVIDFIKGLIVDIQSPIKVAVPMCLSYHPDNKPLTEDEILARARGE